MSFLLGLTGSIGMGKSTTAQMFAAEGCALWDADAAVHRLYDVGGAAVAPLATRFPQVIEKGAVSRVALKKLIDADPSALQQIEQIVHPLVAEDRANFLKATQTDIVVLDIPLLYEKGGEKRVDAVVCVSIPAQEQEKRVLDRGTMTREQFEMIKAKQMPNEEKSARADYVVITDTIEHAQKQVRQIVQDIRGKIAHA